MVATPMVLEDALRFNGYTIERKELAAFDVVLPEGTINVPTMFGSELVWRREYPATPGDAFYLDRLPVFHESYRPVILSNILDRFGTRRIGYSTPDAFSLALRRWANVNLGPHSIINQMYLSAAVKLALTTIDITVDGTRHESSAGTSETDDNSTTNTDDTSSDTTNASSKGRDAQSDFPQGMLAGNTDYASGAVDQVNSGQSTAEQQRLAEIASNSRSESLTSGTRDETEHRHEVGRSGKTAMELLAEQRALFINPDQALLDAMEPLFLGVFDRGEYDGPQYGSPFGFGYR